jgi:hypothetical protein
MIRTARRIGLGLLLSAAAAAGVTRFGAGQSPGSAHSPEAAAAAGGCSGRVANHRLDFWIGDWQVYAGGALDGTNHIASILDGCAVQEEWTDRSGYQGRSWFYVDPATGRLKQVWLTSRAAQLGGTKEKMEMPGGAPRTVQFQGTLIGNSGGEIIDRTTLTLQLDGTVRQVIEISKDGAGTWKIVYDALYRRCGRSKSYPLQM